MITVWKYSIPSRDRDVHPHEDIEMPRDARVLNVDGTNLWAMVDTKAPPVPRRVLFVGTGREVPILDYHEFRPITARFVATIVQPPYVWHVFDCGEPKEG